MQNNNNYLKNLHITIDDTINIIVTNKNLEKRNSTIANAGLGVFALEDIPNNAVF